MEFNSVYVNTGAGGRRLAVWRRWEDMAGAEEEGKKDNENKIVENNSDRWDPLCSI
jgi:hypothetical protein